MTFNGGASNSLADDRNVFLTSTEVNNTYEEYTVAKTDTQPKSIVGIFTLKDEDHTVGQLLRHTCEHRLKNSSVIGCEYIIPHPLENIMKVRCQTVAPLTPPVVIDEACASIINDLEQLKIQLQELFPSITDVAKIEAEKEAKENKK
jgi:DNA-directed RNA polymerase subunit L